MTTKELLYVEDALGHEKYFQTKCKETASQIQDAETDEEMLDACKQFESYLVQQMFKSMEESAKVFSDDDEDNSNDYVNMFQDNYLSAIADQMVNSGQGLGIADKLYESMVNNKV